MMGAVEKDGADEALTQASASGKAQALVDAVARTFTEVEIARLVGSLDYDLDAEDDDDEEDEETDDEAAADDEAGADDEAAAGSGGEGSDAAPDDKDDEEEEEEA